MPRLLPTLLFALPFSSLAATARGKGAAILVP